MSLSVARRSANTNIDDRAADGDYDDADFSTAGGGGGGGTNRKAFPLQSQLTKLIMFLLLRFFFSFFFFAHTSASFLSFVNPL